MHFAAPTGIFCSGTKYRLYLGLLVIKQALYEMKMSDSVKPISYLKSHTAQVLRDVSEGQKTMVSTQHGEAKAVLQDISSYEQTQESLALLKMLALSGESLQEGRSKPARKAFLDIHKRIKEQTR